MLSAPTLPFVLLTTQAGAATGTGTLTSSDGYVTLATTGPVTLGTPYSSGQIIDISVGANPTLSLTNLEASGYSGEPIMKAEMCADPGGLAVNLPTTPTNHCDGSTLYSTSEVNAEGSFTLDDYQVFALPDSISLGEPSTGVPVCGTGNDECVLFLGPDQLNFGVPHLFSAPFSVQANSDDGGENPGDGTMGGTQTTQTITFTSTPPSTATVGGATYAVSATGGGSGNPVTFISDTPSICAVSGSTVSFVGPGTCTVEADQSGNPDYAPAPPAYQTFAVEPALAPCGDEAIPRCFTSGANTADSVGSTFSFSVMTSGSPLPKIKAKGKLPKGVKFHQGTGYATISGTPTSTKQRSAVGTYTITITATFGKGKAKAVVTQAFTLTVT